VLAFDVGTTYSGISYSVLDPGQVPEIKGVARFPAQENISGASKIPTVIYYDRSGKVRAVGAEAMKESILLIADDENSGWVKAEWFKLHLRSKVGAGRRSIGDELPPLPPNKTVAEVLGDLLRYLFECASSYIKDTHADGPELWNSVKSDIDFVISHPNGWEGTQQSEMRRAAVLAGLVPDNESGHSRLSFVTEGEASLHFSVENGLPAGAMENGDGVVIADVGGGTVDISSYSRNQKGDFEEIAPAQCHLYGSVFVNINARLFLMSYLSDSPFLDDLEHIICCFDKTTKLRFRDAEVPDYVKFGSSRDNDKSCEIRKGQLKLMGTDIAKFFQPSIDCIVKAVREQKNSAHKPISHVVLVGGFAASDWLFSKVNELLTPLKLNIVRPENHVNKAVTNGAISFYLDHLVRTRVSKVTFGTVVYMPYNPNDPDHKSRSHKVITDFSGVKRIVTFDIILPKNTQVSETKEFRNSYFWPSDSYFLPSSSGTSHFLPVKCDVLCYRGNV